MLMAIVGSSGAGKSTLIETLLSNLPAKLLPSWTTRPKREQELNGSNYIHITKQEFIDNQKKGNFSLVTHYADNYYGTCGDDLIWATQAHELVIADLDVKSVLEIYNNLSIPVKLIYLHVDLETCQTRMKNRGDSIEDMEIRTSQYLKDATEILNALAMGYNPIFILDGRKSTSSLFKEVFKISQDNK